jgi:hypothetical protein
MTSQCQSLAPTPARARTLCFLILLSLRTIGPSGAMYGWIECDPNTGRFTAASFANFPDELLD